MYIWYVKEEPYGIKKNTGTSDKDQNRIDTSCDHPVFYRTIHLFLYVQAAHRQAKTGDSQCKQRLILQQSTDRIGTTGTGHAQYVSGITPETISAAI